MNLPNLLTLSRLPFLFVIAGLLMVPGWGALLALIVFGLAALSDWVDGWLARRQGCVSDFGKLMDALTDKILIVGMFVALLALGLLPFWALFFVLLIIAREFFVTGLRLVAASRGAVLAAERSGKIKTVAQITAILLLLAAHALVASFGLQPEGFAAWVRGAGIFTFLAASLLTVYSGVGYTWKHLGLLRG